MFSSESDEWATPKDFYDKLNDLFGPFTLDPAATHENHKCDKYYTIEENGLVQSWKDEVVFLNPPYSRGKQKLWIEKAYNEALKYQHTKAVLLLPVRTDTKIFHKYCLKADSILFVKGRLKFYNPTKKTSTAAPFPSMIVLFDKLPSNYPTVGSIERT